MNHDNHSVDFLQNANEPEVIKSKRSTPKRVAKWIALGLVGFAIAGTALSYKVTTSHMNNEEGGFSFFNTFRQLVTSDEKFLAGEENDRINFLLLGVGGDGHAGGQLADTIIFSSLRPSTGEVGMLSIPRDTIVEIDGYGFRKINSVNAYAEAEQKGSGLEASAKTIGTALNQPVHYTVKVDFGGFQELIDAIGGVDVYVERSFTDAEFPTWDEKYQVISFQTGWQHMDGETALQYARSRHGNNGEGSDFARAKRQQKVLLAVKDKILSPGTLLNPVKMNKMIETFQKNVETNLSVWELTKLATLVPSVNTENIHHHVLDTGPNSPLYASNINGAYVILPKKDDWSEVQAIAQSIITTGGTEIDSGVALERISSNVAIEIQNGTNVTGLAFQASQLLESSGFSVEKIGNAESRGYEKTIIYDLTGGKKQQELSVLEEFLKAEVPNTEGGWVYSDIVEPRNLSVTTPGEDYVTSGENIDFLIILGENASQVVLR